MTTTPEHDGHFGMRANRAQLDRFNGLAKTNHRTAAQLVREFMDGYIAAEERRLGIAAQSNLFEAAEAKDKTKP